jgi:non-specific serine/threonine protein kinase
MRGLLTEGRAWINRALRLPGGTDGDRARSLAGAGMLARLQGDLPAARDGLEEAARRAGEVGERRTRAEALTELGIVSAALGEVEAAEAQLAEAWRIWQEEGDAWGRLSALHARAKLALAQADPEGARALREEAVELARATGDAEWEARALVGLGEIARHQGDHRAARTHFDRALELYREIRNPVHTALALRKLAHAALHLGDLRGAREALLESLRAFRRVDQRGGVAACAVGLACVRSAEGDDAGAVRLLAASGLLAADETGVLQPADVADRDAALARSRARLGERAFEEAVGQGRITPLDQLLAALEVSAPPVPAAARTAAGPLTAREMDVLRLLPQGLSYAEMGRKLFISPRTVDAHLRAIYAKLSVRSRHEAALYAQRHDLA